jgi:hypothetical protein
MAQNAVKLERFGLFIVLLGRFSTGSSFFSSGSHRPYCLDHSVPLSTTS